MAFLYSNSSVKYYKVLLLSINAEQSLAYSSQPRLLMRHQTKYNTSVQILNGDHISLPMNVPLGFKIMLPQLELPSLSRVIPYLHKINEQNITYKNTQTICTHLCSCCSIIWSPCLNNSTSCFYTRSKWSGVDVFFLKSNVLFFPIF